MKTEQATPKRSRSKAAVNNETSLIKRVYSLNRAMNNAKALYEKARKELYVAMKKQNVSSLLVETVDEDNSPLILEAVIETPTRYEVDAKKLKVLVPENVFMEMVEVPQKAVTEHAGDAILRQVLVPTKGTENVKVLPKN